MKTAYILSSQGKRYLKYLVHIFPFFPIFKVDLQCVEMFLSFLKLIEIFNFAMMLYCVILHASMLINKNKGWTWILKECVEGTLKMSGSTQQQNKFKLQILIESLLQIIVLEWNSL